MPILSATQSPTFDLPGLHVTGHAAPSRGARETSVWRIRLAPGAPGAEHTVDREEIFVALSGRAAVTLAGERHDLGPGDALVVPAGVPFSLANADDAPFEAIAVLPVGGRATLPGGEPFVPPWSR
jgi:quercetin dioxygenase-like cupin family protein